MSLALLFLLVVVLLAAGYRLYGELVAAHYRLDPDVATPADAKRDGVDFVPTRPFYLMGQHFSAIAAAGPIVGPIAACLTFGWLPCILWIVLGVVFIGAVHDFSALVASVRHDARSIAEIARQNLGRRAWLALIAFVWLALVYVIVAFADVTASTFVGKTEELTGAFAFNPGGAVAAASTTYLLLALLMGVVERRFSPPIALQTAIFVPATLAAVWLGTRISTWLVFDATTWVVLILAYCFVASLLPVWLLQQPRGYLGGFVLYLALGVGLVGVLFGGFEIRQPAWTPGTGGIGAWLSAEPGGTGAPRLDQLLFPFLFVTIACGACSGFHGLVCGGTTSKQIAKEPHCKPIGFGAMLLEGLVAVLALATVMIVAPSDVAGRAPGKLYGDGIASFVSVLLGEEAFLFAATFGAMAFSTFVFDTLDVATRLGRYLLQELTGRQGRVAGLAAAAATAGTPMVVLLSAAPGSWKAFWVLFGASNQLLASLTLLGITVWLYRTGRRYWFTLLPTLFVMAVTVSALALQVVLGVKALRAAGSDRAGGAMLNAAVAAALLALAGIFIAEALRAVADARRAKATAIPAG